MDKRKLKKIKIVTHKNPDIDSLVSVYLFQELIGWTGEVYFRSVYDNMDDVDSKSTVYIDISPLRPVAGKVFDHHKSEGNSSCVSAEIIQRDCLIPQWYNRLVYEAHQADKFKDINYKGVRLRDVIEGIKSRMKEQKAYSDINFMEQVFDIFRMIVKNEKGFYEAWNKHKNKVRKENISSYTIFIYTGEPDFHLIGYLFNYEGGSLLIYKDGNNVGVLRNAALNHPDLKKLKPLIDPIAQEQWLEWFYHPEGFIACRGSIKNPANTPGKVGVEDLLNALRFLLGERKNN